jgi:hypothetical protein
MTLARVSQVVAEAIRTNTGVAARVSQVAAEVLRINTGTVIRASQVAVEVLRPNAAEVAEIEPGEGTLAFTGYAPTLAQSSHVALAPGVGSLAITGYVPTVAVTANTASAPGVGSFAFTGYAPTVGRTESRIPGVGSLSFTGYAPTIARTTYSAPAPGVGTLTITGYAPSVERSGMTITGYAPTVSRQDSDTQLDLSHEKIFVHTVVLPAYTFYSTVEGLEGIPIEVPSVSFSISSGPLVGMNAYIIDPGSVRQDVFPSGRTPGLVSPSYGNATYMNVAGNLESLLLGVPTDGAKVTCWWGPKRGTFPDDFVIDFIAYIDGTPRITQDDITISLRDRSGLFDAQVATQGFDNALSDSAGTRRRQIVYGTPGLPAPILYHPFEVGNEWFVQLNPAINIDSVYDGGVQLINQGEASSASDLGAGAAPNPSSYRWYYEDGSVDPDYEGLWIRLGSKVRVDLRYTANSESATITELAVAAGITDAETMEAASEDLGVGSRVIETQTYRAVFDDVAKARISIIGFSRADEFMQRYIVPSHSTDYDTDFTFTDGQNSHDWAVYSESGLDKRIWELKVNAGATEAGQLANIPDLSGSAAESISRERWLTSFVAAIPEMQDDGGGVESISLDIESNEFGNDQAAMLAYAAQMFDLFGSVSVCTWLTAQYDTDTAALQLMDRVTLSGTRMTTGKKGRIISIDRQLAQERIRFGIWTHYSTVPESAVELTSVDDGTAAAAGSATSRGSRNVRLPEATAIACGTPTTVVEVGVANSFHWPYRDGMRLTAIEAGLAVDQTSGDQLTVDVLIDGVSAFGIPITFDNGDERSAEAAVQPTLTTFEILYGQKVEFEVTQVGDGTAMGLTVYLVGYQ